MQTDFVLKSHGHVGVRGEDELDESAEGGVAVDEVSQLVSHHEAQFGGCHEVEEARVDVDDVWMLLVFGSQRESVDGGVAGDIEVDGFVEVQLRLHFVAQVVEVGQQFGMHFQAMAFHGAAPVGVAAAGFGFAQHLFHHRSLQGGVNLLTELLLKLYCGVEFIHGDVIFSVKIGCKDSKTFSIEQGVFSPATRVRF